MTVHSLGIGSAGGFPTMAACRGRSPRYSSTLTAAIDLAPRQFTTRAVYRCAKAREARVLGPLMANQLFACSWRKQLRGPRNVS
jgi:hypothetical protein